MHTEDAGQRRQVPEKKPCPGAVPCAPPPATLPPRPKRPRSVVVWDARALPSSRQASSSPAVEPRAVRNGLVQHPSSNAGGRAPWPFTDPAIWVGLAWLRGQPLPLAPCTPATEDATVLRALVRRGKSRDFKRTVEAHKRVRAPRERERSNRGGGGAEHTRYHDQGGRRGGAAHDGVHELIGLGPYRHLRCLHLYPAPCTCCPDPG